MNQRLADTEKKLATLGKELITQADLLSGTRKKTALKLEKAISQELSTLSFATAEFKAELAGSVAGATEGAKLKAQIAAIPEKVQAQYKADFKAGAPQLAERILKRANEEGLRCHRGPSFSVQLSGSSRSTLPAVRSFRAAANKSLFDLQITKIENQARFAE